MKNFCSALLLVVICVSSAFGQASDGNIVGSVLDPSGSGVPNAKVELDNVATGVKATRVTDESGSYRFNNVLIGNYTVTVSAAGFTTSSLKNVLVELNKTTTANVPMQVGPVATTIDVTEAAALIDTTTAQIANNYDSRMAMLPSAVNPTGGVLNLSLLGAGVVSAGGFGTAEGPSVGGQRPRNNNFMVEGTDNNRTDVTGSIVRIPGDAVAEFTVLQNQFSAEFGHSSGGQFNTVIKGGTNTVHGSIFEYMENRNLEALDEQFKRQGVKTRPRRDENRLGGSLGGPILKNKLFAYGLFQYRPIGEASTSSSATYTPTAAGYQALSSIPGLSKTNLDILQKYATAAPAQDGSRAVAVRGVSIPLGILPIQGPVYENNYDWLVSVDYTLSANDQFRFRYVDNNTSTIDTVANLPVFYVSRPITRKLLSISEFHNFSPNFFNELKLGYNRYNAGAPITDDQFPGLDVFPNIDLRAPLNLQIGPHPSFPQDTILSTAQIGDNVTWIKGRHDLKFGVDLRDMKQASTFIQRKRGDYSYSTLERYLLDLVPDRLAQRNIGGKPYSGDARAYYFFANDNWKFSRRLTINLGMRYEYNGIPQSMKEFDLNKLADVPGVLTFAAPRPQKKNFAPRVGFAYTPGDRADTVFRGGFGIAYDQVFNNVGTNSRPPQVTSTVNRAVSDTPGFLANGGITPSEVPASLSPAAARAASSSWLGDQKQGYAINWNFGVQRVFARDYTIEARYVGTRGVHLLFQTQLNRIAIVTPDHQLPTFLQAPSQSALDALPLNLAGLTAERNARGNIFAQHGFTSVITAYVPTGNSTYHGLALDLNRRFSKNLLLKAGYTWSHAIDDSTAEVNSTAITPRRPQDFFNRDAEKASSLLDRRQRFVFSWLYETPWFSGSSNWALKHVLGGYQFSGTYSAEAGEWATPQSAVDANMNGDAAGDRVIINPGGAAGTSSDVTRLCRGGACSQYTGAALDQNTVGYLATNPNARFIRAQVGTFANGGRNILPMNGINNFDLSVAKTVKFGERYGFTVRADFRNAFNHPQFVPGQINNVNFRSGLNDVVNYLTPGDPVFGQYDKIFRSNARKIQVGAVVFF